MLHVTCYFVPVGTHQPILTTLLLPAALRETTYTTSVTNVTQVQ